MSEEWIFTTDDDGHWYMIPPDYKDRFEQLIDEYRYDDFNTEFGMFRSFHPSQYVVNIVRVL